MSTEDVRNRRIQLRADDSLGEGVVRGYVSTFDDPYDIGWGGTREVIKRDTFSLDKAIPLFYEHDWTAGPIGVSRSLRSDSKGLEAEFELFLDDPRARSVWRAMKAGALREFSIGFLANKIERSMDEKLETITEGELLEVSSVVKGANPNTETVATRAVPPAAAPVPAPAAPGAVPPAHPAPEVPEEEKPTKTALLAAVGEVVAMAIELKMGEQLAAIVKQYLKILDDAGAGAEHAPPPPGHEAPPPPPPAARNLPDGLVRALVRK